MATVLLTSIGACLAYGNSNTDQQETATNLKVKETFPFLPATIANINLPVAFYLASPASLAAILGAKLAKGVRAKPLNV